MLRAACLGMFYFVGMWAAFSMTESLKLAEKLFFFFLKFSSDSKCSDSVTAGDSMGLPSMAVCWEHREKKWDWCSRDGHEGAAQCLQWSLGIKKWNTNTTLVSLAEQFIAYQVREVNWGEGSRPGECMVDKFGALSQTKEKQPKHLSTMTCFSWSSSFGRNNFSKALSVFAGRGGFTLFLE